MASFPLMRERKRCPIFKKPVPTMFSVPFMWLNRQKVFEVLTSSDKSPPPEKPLRRKNDAQADEKNPEWTQGLRQLDNSVVEEPLPANFKDLLDKLDKGT